MNSLYSNDDVLLIHKGIYAKGRFPTTILVKSEMRKYVLERINLGLPIDDPRGWQVLSTPCTVVGFHMLSRLDKSTIVGLDSLSSEHRDTITKIIKH